MSKRKGQKETTKRAVSLKREHKLFVDKLLLDPKRHATRAYMEVYGCSESAAAVNASRLLRNAKVLAYKEEREAEIARKLQERYQVTQERILKEISMLAFARMSDVATWGENGVEFIPTEVLDEYVKAGILEVSETRNSSGGTIKLKLADKTKALEILGKHLGLFQDKHKYEVGLTGEVMRKFFDLPDTTGLPSEHGSPAKGKL